MSAITLTREELHALVWAEPLKRIAERLSLTGARLAELCDRHAVPRPPQGHWTRVALGLPVQTCALPLVPVQASELVPIAKPVSPRNQAGADRLPQRADIPRLEVRERLVHPHPVVARWSEDRRREVQTGAAVYMPHLRRVIQPTPANAKDRRRYLVADALFKAVERAGVLVEGGPRGIPTMTYGRETLEFQVRYRLKQVKRELTAEELRWHDPKSSRWKSELQETESLVCAIRTWLPRGTKVEWDDSQRAPVEALLREVQTGILQAFAALSELRKQRLEEQQCHERLAAESRAREQARKLEEDRFRMLIEQARRWREVELARALVDALRGSVPRDFAPGGIPAEEWIAWADQAIAKHDPLADGGARVFEAIAAVTPGSFRDVDR